jgi:inosine/xanthosine triphosphate pyrophosphatase family protein
MAEDKKFGDGYDSIFGKPGAKKKAPAKKPAAKAAAKKKAPAKKK